MGRGQHDEATELLTGVRRPGSTNPADVAVGQALARVAAYATPRPEPAGPTDPVRSRPASRVRPNPFRVGP